MSKGLNLSLLKQHKQSRSVYMIMIMCFFVQNRYYCYCGNAYDRQGSSSYCNRQCAGNSSQSCGGSSSFSVHSGSHYSIRVCTNSKKSVTSSVLLSSPLAIYTWTLQRGIKTEKFTMAACFSK